MAGSFADADRKRMFGYTLFLPVSCRSGGSPRFAVMGISKPNGPNSGGHNGQKVHLMPVVGRFHLLVDSSVFLLSLNEKTLANVGNVWYLMLCQAAIIRCTLR